MRSVVPGEYYEFIGPRDHPCFADTTVGLVYLMESDENGSIYYTDDALDKVDIMDRGINLSNYFTRHVIIPEEALEL